MPSNKQRSLVDIACRVRVYPRQYELLLICAYTQASADTLSTHLPLTYTPASTTTTYSIAIVPGPSLPPSLKQTVWKLYELNMRTLSEGSSMGWDPKEKQRELWHPDSRFIVLRPLRQQGDKGKGKAREGTKSGAELAAFAMFRFDWEGCMDPEWEADECEVLYCYELQVAPSARRLGMGKFLVDQLVLLAREYRMRKVMLTCLKANTSALAFYRSQGFIVDAISPSQVAARSAPSAAGGETLDGDTEWEDDDEEAECDFEIMSRRVT
ncbi:hypothetical protein CALCODRAFT_491710 [Calocera cornea HHB12733]|uniref:N-alpha-acetyltransferase 40 n=1 Tax=Calocera cornea HHB12733 TaxID=1353952 RepID=A0A165IVR6_9BASI|nr:hypothetical protein CALCODRAFT_491710 [Calocera cornea HHB12733]